MSSLDGSRDPFFGSAAVQASPERFDQKPTRVAGRIQLSL
jgi:hypothetical protein